MMTDETIDLHDYCGVERDEGWVLVCEPAGDCWVFPNELALCAAMDEIGDYIIAHFDEGKVAGIPLEKFMEIAGALEGGHPVPL